MRCLRHDLAAAPDGTCVRCRAEEAEASAGEQAERERSRLRLGTIGVVAFVVLSAIAVAGVRWWEAPRALVVAPSLPPPVSSGPAPASTPLAALESAAVSAEPTPSAAPGGPSRLDRAMHDAAVTLYCRPSPACDRERAWLLARGFVYRERNVDADPSAASVWHRVAPDGTLPVVDVDGKPFAGFDPERVQHALEYAGARRLQR